eukprot:gene11724-8069_t
MINKKEVLVPLLSRGKRDRETMRHDHPHSHLKRDNSNAIYSVRGYYILFQCPSVNFLFFHHLRRFLFLYTLRIFFARSFLRTVTYEIFFQKGGVEKNVPHPLLPVSSREHGTHVPHLSICSEAVSLTIVLIPSVIVYSRQPLKERERNFDNDSRSEGIYTYITLWVDFPEAVEEIQPRAQTLYQLTLCQLPSGERGLRSLLSLSYPRVILNSTATAGNVKTAKLKRKEIVIIRMYIVISAFVCFFSLLRLSFL